MLFFCTCRNLISYMYQYIPHCVPMVFLWHGYWLGNSRCLNCTPKASLEARAGCSRVCSWEERKLGNEVGPKYPQGTLIAKPFQASLSEQYSVVLNWLANSWTRHSYINLRTDLPLAIQRLLHYSEQFHFKHATNKLLYLLLNQIYFPCDVNKLEVMASACTMISTSSFSSWLQSQSYLNCVPWSVVMDPILK